MPNSTEEQFALFVFFEYEALGGADDLVLIGSMQECMGRAAQCRDGQVAHIARMDTMDVVKRGEWRYIPSVLVGHAGRQEFVWD